MRRHSLAVAMMKSYLPGVISSLLLLLELLLVEDKLFALEDVPVTAPALTRARGNARHQTTARELILKIGIQALRLVAALQLRVHVSALAFGLDVLLGLNFLAQVPAVVREVPLLEGRRVHLDDGILDQGLRAHKLVVCGVVDNVHDTRLAGAVLGPPRVIPRVQAQCTILHVTSTAADEAHTLLTHSCHRRRPSHLELALLLVNVHAAARLAVLVAGVTSNAHDEKSGGYLGVGSRCRFQSEG